MGWFDSTNAILGIKEAQRARKNDRWSKLMDIASVLQNTAGLGADIWKTVSGRKHDFALASTNQGYTTSNMQLGLDLDKQMADKQAELQEAKAQNDQERTIALQQEIARLQEEQAKRDYPREASLRSISAGGSAADRANSLFDVIDNIKSSAQGTYWKPDEMGTGVMFVRSPEETMSYFESMIAAAKLNEGDAQIVRDALTQWISNPTSGMPGQAAAKEPVDIAGLLETIKALAGAAREANPNAELETPKSEGAIAIQDPTSLLANVAGPLAGIGYSMAQKSWNEADENALAKSLNDIRNNYNIPDEKTKADIDKAVAALSAPGKVQSKEVYDAFVTMKKSLETLYQSVRRGR